MNLKPNSTGMVPDRDADPLLDRTLAHFASTEPAPGLNARLLLRLQTQVPAQATRNRQPRWVWLLSVPTVVAAALLALLLSHTPLFPYPPTPASPKFSKLKKPQLATDQQNHAFPEQAAQPGQRNLHPPPTHSESKTEQQYRPLLVQVVQARPKSHLSIQAGTQALDDLLAPSHPAPPLPLTAQERAILHLLHRDGTVELAQLDPALQTRLFELQQATFQQFFDPPPPPKFEGETK